MADFDKALALNATDAWACFFRGLAHKESGEREEAIADLERALALGLSSYLAQAAEQVLEELRGQ